MLLAASAPTLLFTALFALTVQAASVDMYCVSACVDYSVTLGHCRGAFEFNPHQTNVSYATEFVKCICDGTKGDGILGQEKMMESVNICGGCATTPSVIKGNLGLVQLCEGIASCESDQGVMSFAPFGYSVLTWNAQGKPNEAEPTELVLG